MAQGDVSKMAIAEEQTYGVLPGVPDWTRVTIADEKMVAKIGYEDPKVIQGDRIKGDNIATKKEVSGSASVVMAPENGTGQIIKFALGTLTTYAGYFHRQRRLATGAEPTLALVNVPLTALSDRVWKKLSGASARTELTRVVPAPGTGEYSINNTTGMITFGDALAAGDEIWVEYAEVASGPYSHVMRNAQNQPSFAFWNSKGLIDLFEYSGCKVNKMGIELKAQSFFKLACDIIAKREKIASDDATPDVFPVGLVLSGLDPFTFKQASLTVAEVAEPTIQTLGIDVDNKLESQFTINCTDELYKITAGTQEVKIKYELEFDDPTHYDRFRNGTFFPMRLIIGECNGVEIGTSGKNYGLQIFMPRVRWESSEIPTKTGTLMVSGDGFANFDSGYGAGIEIVLINSEATL